MSKTNDYRQWTSVEAAEDPQGYSAARALGPYHADVYPDGKPVVDPWADTAPDGFSKTLHRDLTEGRPSDEKMGEALEQTVKAYGEAAAGFVKDHPAVGDALEDFATKEPDPWAAGAAPSETVEDPYPYGPPGSLKSFPGLDTYEELAEHHIDLEYGTPMGHNLDPDRNQVGHIPGAEAESDPRTHWHGKPDTFRNLEDDVTTADEMDFLKYNPATDTYEELEASYKDHLVARDQRLVAEAGEAALKDAGEDVLNTLKSIPGIGEGLEVAGDATVDAANTYHGPTEPLKHPQPSPAELKEMGFDVDKGFVDLHPETTGYVNPATVGHKAPVDATNGPPQEDDPVVEDAVERDTQPAGRGAGPDAQEPKATPAASGAAANLGGSEGLDQEQEQVAEAAFAPEGAAGPAPTDQGENPLFSLDEAGPPTGDVLQTPGAVAADAGDIEMSPEETAGSGETVEDVGGEMPDPVNPYAGSGGFAKEALDEMPDPVVEEDVVDDIY